jgi:hypothetical protein
MSEITVLGVRVTANPAYAFDSFLLQDLGLNKTISLEYLGPEEDPSDEQKQDPSRNRTLWMGWAHKDQGLIAGLLCTPRTDKRYPTIQVDPTTGIAQIGLAQLHEHAKELNFFVYSTKHDAMVYQQRHGSKGPYGFLALLQPLYNREKKRMSSEERSGLDPKLAKEVGARFKEPLKYQVVTTRAKLDALLLKLKSATLTTTVGTADWEEDPYIGPYVKSRKVIVAMAGVVEGERKPWVKRVLDYAASIGGVTRAHGRTDDDQPLTVFLDEEMNKLSFKVYDSEEWADILGGGTFEVKSFPNDLTSKAILRPISELVAILNAHVAALTPDEPV